MKQFNEYVSKDLSQCEMIKKDFESLDYDAYVNLRDMLYRYSAMEYLKGWKETHEDDMLTFDEAYSAVIENDENDEGYNDE